MNQSYQKKLHCICISKVTKFKANNNSSQAKQRAKGNCICISKVTKFKANNNGKEVADLGNITVFA